VRLHRRRVYVLTNRPDYFDPSHFLSFVQVSGGFVQVLLVAISLAALFGCGQRTPVQAASEIATNRAPVSEQDFMINAVQAHLAEIDMARAATTHSKNKEVKSFAKTILKEHTTGLQELQKLMSSKGVPPPRATTSAMKQDIERMSALSGAEFDREFVNMMVSDHQKTLELFRGVSFTAHDTDIQDYVDSMIPKLDKHLRRAQELQSKLFSSPAAAPHS
jgi:putative membrane protein